MLLNCGVGEYSWESLGLQVQTSQSYRKSALSIHCKDWCWSWSSSTLVTWCKEPTHWERPCCWAEGEGGSRGWDVRMASLTQWTWMNLSELQEMARDRRAWHPVVHGITKSQIGLSDWTTTTNIWNLIGKQCKCILLSVLTEGNIYLWCLVCFEQLL